MLKKVNNKGFSIIEVLIVLAIAGLIMLVVFLAVPALRRNSANSARQNDAARISTQVQDCLSNRNGDTTACNTAAKIDVPADTLSQLSAAPAFYTAVAASTSTIAATELGSTNNPDGVKSAVVFNAKCNTSGSDLAYSNNKRDFVVIYEKRTSGASNTTLCIGS